MTDSETNSGGATESGREKKAQKVRWNDKEMRTTYANAVNAVSTMEEVAVFFGVNKSWNPSEDDLEIDLSDRIILNPLAAKRLWTILGAVLQQYEQRFGPLNVLNQQTTNDRAAAKPKT